MGPLMASSGAVKRMHLKPMHLREWESEERPGVFLPDDPGVGALAKRLHQARMLAIDEGRYGLRVTATSWVGRITLGGLQITVEPKISGLPMLRLLRYAYGLRNLKLLGSSSYDPSAHSFLDLLIHQLAAEAEELMRRGLRREY